MSIALDNFLSLLDLDTLVLSNSSSSISSSKSSLFGYDGRLSNSGLSETDISPPISPAKEAGDCLRRDTNSEYCGLPRNAVTETPKPNVFGFIHTVSHQLQGSPKVEYPYAAADEAGYEAEASDGDQAIAASLANKKKKLTKRVSSSSKGDSVLQTELSSALDEDGFESMLFSSSDRQTPPIKPLIRPQSLDLNSPSPIVGLPSPRIKSFFKSDRSRSLYALQNLPLDECVLPMDALSSHLITERSHVRETALCKSTQKPLGLGLCFTGPQSSTSGSPEPAKPKPLVGLGIKLPSANSSPPIASEPVTAKRRSLSSLGLGLPSTLRRSSCFSQGGNSVLPSEATVRLVTPRKNDGDSDDRGDPMDVNFTRQRRASVSFSFSLSNAHTTKRDSPFTNRNLYPILESPTTSPNLPTQSSASVLTSTSTTRLKGWMAFSGSPSSSDL